MSDRTSVMKCMVIINVNFPSHQPQNSICGRPVTSHVLVHKAVLAGTAPQYDIEHVCDNHLRDYRPRIVEGWVQVLTDEEVIVAEVMLS